MTISFVCEDCSNGDLRLADGMTSREGRLEFCLNGEWGTVCQSQFSSNDAQVACNQLGFSPFGNYFLLRMLTVLYSLPRFSMQVLKSLHSLEVVQGPSYLTL